MGKKEILVDEEHLYDLIIEDNKFCLHYSNAEFWHFKGELVLGLKETGNGYKMIKPLRKKNKIDYDEAQELYILLAAVKESKIEVIESKEEL